MNAYNLAQLFMYWGKYIKPEQFGNFKHYLSIMLSRNRVIGIFNGKELECIICYFLTDEMDTFINRPTWSTPKDSDSGQILFIDKMVAKHWTPTLRKLVRDTLEKSFPNAKRAIWLREPFNRNVIINRRGTNERVYA